MRILPICAATLSLLAAAPAFAQSGNMSSGSMSSGSMSSGSMSDMRMSAKSKKMMARCQSMDHDMMMKNAGCAKMMKAHPDMMQGH